MDAKITKKRLGLLLSYDWIKIVGICVAVVLVWSLLFTTMATRPSNGQRFEMYLYPGVKIADKVDEDFFHGKDENGALSYDILDFTANSLTSDTKDTIMTTHFAAGQGDALVAGALEPTTDKDTGKITAYNGIDEFISRFYTNCAWLDPSGATLKIKDGSGKEHEVSNYFADCAKYLDRFYDGDWENGTLNEAKARANFDERMNGDKRYKNEAAREEGRKKEVSRIKNLRDAFKNVWNQVKTENGLVQVRKSELVRDLGEGKQETVQWQFAFDLSNLKKLTDIMSYPDADNNNTGTVDGLCMAVLNTGSSGDEDLRYEMFTLLDFLIKNYAE